MNKRVRHNGEGSIFPYRNGYAAYVWVATSTGTRKRKYIYGKSRDEVHEKWLKLHQQAKLGSVASSTPTLASYLVHWLRDIVEPNLAISTYAKYETFVRWYLVPGLGAKRLDRLHLPDLQRWVNSLSRTCQCCSQGKDARRPIEKQRCCVLGKCCSDFPSASTVSAIVACLRTALQQGIKEELLVRNVAGLVSLPKQRKKAGKAWTSEEARRFLESARKDADPLLAAYILVLVMGMRRGEVLGLMWNDVDFDTAELTVNFQLQRVKRQLLHRDTKTESSQDTLMLPEFCASALQQRRKEQIEASSQAGSLWYQSQFVFTTRYGTPVEPRNFLRSWSARCEKAGVRNITVHDGRRTCATLLVDLDVHPRQIMRILRHAKFSITMEIYAKASTQGTREALRKLGDSLDV